MFAALKRPDPNSGCGFSCKGCYFLGRTLEEMVDHVEEMHDPPDPVQCPYCKGSYRTKPSLRKHISVKHRELHAKVKMKQRL